MSETNYAFTHTEEQAKSTQYLKVNEENTGKTYIFTVSTNDGTTFAKPSTNGETDKENDFAGLKAACKYLENIGYEIHTGGLVPAGFTYP